jgi:uncharacterized DUF497 family protein
MKAQRTNISSESHEEYKDTAQAWYQEEIGNPREDVIVVDNFGGKELTFKWTRGKSNSNITDTGTGKEGFSFYFARYVFRDPCLYKNDALASNPDLTGVIGKVHKDDKEMLVVNAVEETTNIIRIVSAYYADDPKYQLFVERYRYKVVNTAKKNESAGGAERVYSIAAGQMPLDLKNKIGRFLEDRRNGMVLAH